MKKVYTEQNRSGFTLIELLVAIAIIGILSAIGLVAYSAALKQGRDSKRRSDLRSIQSALEMYRADKGEYPCGTVCWPSPCDGCKGTSGGFGYNGYGGGWATDTDDSDACVGWESTYSRTLEDVLKTNGYMAGMPHDPFGGCAGKVYNFGYVYEDVLLSERNAGKTGGRNYCLYATLETLSSGTTVGCDSCYMDAARTYNYCVRSP